MLLVAYCAIARGLDGLVTIHSAASAKGPGFNSPVAQAYLRLILRPLHWQASSVGYAQYGCNKLWSYNAV